VTVRLKADTTYVYEMACSVVSRLFTKAFVDLRALRDFVTSRRLHQKPIRVPTWNCRGNPPPASDVGTRKVADRMSPVGFAKFGSLLMLNASKKKSNVRPSCGRRR
jgi:hypothetical protein